MRIAVGMWRNLCDRLQTIGAKDGRDGGGWVAAGACGDGSMDAIGDMAAGLSRDGTAR
jgi:hypothetical protein